MWRLTPCNFDAGQIVAGRRAEDVTSATSLDDSEPHGTAETEALLKCLSQNTRLRKLKLCGRFNPPCCSAMVRVLDQCSSLTSVTLTRNRLQPDPDNFGVLCSGLSRAVSLRTLSLAVNEDLGCSEDGAGSLAAVLPSCPSLTSLNLSRTGITPVGARALSSALPHCNIRTLSFSECGIGDVGAEALGLAIPLSSVTSLDVTDCSLSSSSGLARCLDSPNLRTLVAADNRDTDWEPLFNRLATATGLTSLSLAECSVGLPSCVSLLMGALVANTSLRTLDLEAACLGDRGPEVASMLAHQSSITRLNIADNDIPDVAAVVGIALADNRFVEELRLDGNDSPAEGWEPLRLTLQTKNVSMMKLPGPRNSYFNVPSSIKRLLSRNRRRAARRMKACLLFVSIGQRTRPTGSAPVLTVGDGDGDGEGSGADRGHGIERETAVARLLYRLRVSRSAGPQVVAVIGRQVISML